MAGGDYTASNLTGASTTNGTWDVWIDATGSSSNDTWTGWIDIGTTSGALSWQASQPGEEQIAARKEAEAAKKATESRARELLLSVLDGGQKKAYRKDRKFPVVGSNGKRYLLGDHVTAELGDAGKVVARFCIHTKAWQIPQADQVLARKLLLEADEDTFLRIANRSLVRQAA